jgi:hypothetical protein
MHAGAALVIGPVILNCPDQLGNCILWFPPLPARLGWEESRARGCGCLGVMGPSTAHVGRARRKGSCLVGLSSGGASSRAVPMLVSVAAPGIRPSRSAGAPSWCMRHNAAQGWASGILDTSPSLADGGVSRSNQKVPCPRPGGSRERAMLTSKSEPKRRRWYCQPRGRG